MPENNMNNEWAIILGNYINAYSIIKSLKEINWNGRIVCIKWRDEGKVLTELFDSNVQFWVISLERPEDIIDVINDHIPINDRKVIFFCDEMYHSAFRDYAPQKLQNARYFIGSFEKLDIILDKFALYQYLQENKLAQVPLTISTEHDPWSVFKDAFFIRPKWSYKGIKKLPRVTLIRNSKQLFEIEANFHEWGLTRTDWCYQEKLSLNPQHNISICGWHDDKNHFYYTTHHIFRHPTESGNGDVTEIVEPRKGLLDVAKKVLESIQYQGPFELEFVLDLKDNEYKILELNPRFWMQHYLIDSVSGHSLVRKYLGMEDVKFDRTKYYPVWLNTVYLFFRVLKLDFRVFPYIVNLKNVFVPDLLTAVKWIPFRLWKLIKR